MRGEIADQISTAARAAFAPVAGVLVEQLTPVRIDVIGDDAGYHGSGLSC